MRRKPSPPYLKSYQQEVVYHLPPLPSLPFPHRSRFEQHLFKCLLPCSVLSAKALVPSGNVAVSLIATPLDQPVVHMILPSIRNIQEDSVTPAIGGKSKESQ